MPQPAAADTTGLPSAGAAESNADARLPVEIGWVIAGRIDKKQRRAVDKACGATAALLNESFPAHFFRLVVVERSRAPETGPVEIVDLLDLGSLERDAAGWDFACVYTASELRSYDKPFALGAPASSLNVAAVSLARLPPLGGPNEGDSEDDAFAKRVTALFLHLFGHLNDLPHEEDAEDFMKAPETPRDLDAMRRFSAAGVELLQSELAREADLRVEEEGTERSAFAFYGASTWRNRRDIVQSVLKAQPWLFMVKLSRLTTTATSTLALLMLTAESWDLGMSQRPLGVFVGSVAAIGCTSAYVLTRQGLLKRPRRRQLTEQRVAGNVSATAIVIIAMASAYVFLFLTSLVAGRFLYSRELIHGWASSLKGHITLTHYLTMSGFVANLGVILGALGASFEQEKYFRHVAIVDEET